MPPRNAIACLMAAATVVAACLVTVRAQCAAPTRSLGVVVEDPASNRFNIMCSLPAQAEAEAQISEKQFESSVLYGSDPNPFTTRSQAHNATAAPVTTYTFATAGADCVVRESVNDGSGKTFLYKAPMFGDISPCANSSAIMDFTRQPDAYCFGSSFTVVVSTAAGVEVWGFSWAGAGFTAATKLTSMPLKEKVTAVAPSLGCQYVVIDRSGMGHLLAIDVNAGFQTSPRSLVRHAWYDAEMETVFALATNWTEFDAAQAQGNPQTTWGIYVVQPQLQPSLRRVASFTGFLADHSPFARMYAVDFVEHTFWQFMSATQLLKVPLANFELPSTYTAAAKPSWTPGQALNVYSVGA